MQIAIMGSIGAGKSSATSLLAERLGGSALFEPVVDNPYLDLFYKDMHTYAFPLQVYFLSHRLRNACADSPKQGLAFVDRTVYEDRDIFAKHLHAQGYMNDRDFATYQHIFDTMEPFFHRPDVYIYLKASLPTLMEHIAKRDRACEKDLDPDYVGRLNHLYEAMVQKLGLRGETVITFDMDQLDITSDAGAQEMVDLVSQVVRVKNGRLS